MVEWLVGGQKDKLIDRFNIFLINLSNLDDILSEMLFPQYITKTLYLPILFLVGLLNLIKQDVIIWIATFIISAMGMAFIGCVIAIFFVMIKGSIQYRARHGTDGMPGEED